jgi:hypothetical protein
MSEHYFSGAAVAKRFSSAVWAFGIVCVVGAAADAGTILTQTADWNYSAFGGSAPAVAIQDAAATGGATYVNSFGDSNPGDFFRSVGAVPISQLIRTDGSSISNVTQSANSALLVYAIQGVSQPGGVQKFTQGAYEIISVTDGAISGVDLQKPSNWGVLSSGSVVAYGSIETPQDVQKGAASAYDVTLSASQVNLLGPTTTNLSQLNGQIVATLLPTPNALLTNFSVGGYTGSATPSVVFANIQESIVDTQGLSYIPGTLNYVLPSSELANANAVFGALWSQAGLSNADPGGNPLAFNFSSNSTYSGSSGGGTTQYNPTTGVAGGDFAVTFNSDVTTPAATVPEPSSLTLCGVMLAVTVLFLGRTRKK